MKNLKLLVKLSYDFMKKLKNLILFLIILTNFSCIKRDTKIVCDGDFLNGKSKGINLINKVKSSK